MSRKRKPFLRALIFALIMMVLINVPHVYREGWTVENIIQIIFVFLFSFGGMYLFFKYGENKND
ncbi:hypothetical protein EDL98_01030 [Ornithobacterium rhinotracheale]|uniref:hypothetical protein n=1 Tax=Ornithobacterium rhinotracheale TaxID=28251 RepID=UPI00129D063F|nr:hypothetical protein [Ornithobacterium rhinotracheale]MRJ09674.1 hypothetical protein [Ornithobacterium rhinotracheale]